MAVLFSIYLIPLPGVAMMKKKSTQDVVEKTYEKRLTNYMVDRSCKHVVTWENGGAVNAGTASVVMIADRNGGPKPSQYLKSTENGAHALIQIEEGDFVIRLTKHQGDLRIIVHQIVSSEVETRFTEDVFYPKGANENSARLNFRAQFPEILDEHMEVVPVDTSTDLGALGDFKVIFKIPQHTAKVNAVLAARCIKNTWEWAFDDAASVLQQVINKALAKSEIVNCRSAMFTIVPDKKARKNSPSVRGKLNDARGGNTTPVGRNAEMLEPSSSRNAASTEPGKKKEKKK